MYVNQEDIYKYFFFLLKRINYFYDDWQLIPYVFSIINAIKLELIILVFRIRFSDSGITDPDPTWRNSINV